MTKKQHVYRYRSAVTGRWVTRYRSAVTGRYVKAAYARRYPARTVRERVR
jgi:hypothetical protein